MIIYTVFYFKSFNYSEKDGLGERFYRGWSYKLILQWLEIF